MMKFVRLIFILLLTGCFLQNSQSQVRKDTIPGDFLVLAVPTLGYQPETSLSFGMVFFSTIRTGGSFEKSRLSNMELDILYTLKKQFIADLDHSLYFFDNKLIAAGSNSLYKFPELFYGLGSSTSDSLSEQYSANRIELDNSFLYQIRPNFYAGIVQRFQQLRNLEFEEGSLMLKDQITGTDGGISNGLGLGLVFDNRTNQINPKAGKSYLKLSWTNFSGAFGSDYLFNRFELDARHYFKASKKGLIAVQTYGVFNTGDTPFRLTGMLGGSRIMRGYYQGRYRDRQYLALQAEYRTPVYKRFGMVVFGGLGNVGYNFNDLFESAPKYSLGTGLRFLLDKNNSSNIRLDFALGRHSNGIYLSYGECF